MLTITATHFAVYQLSRTLENRTFTCLSEDVTRLTVETGLKDCSFPDHFHYIADILLISQTQKLALLFIPGRSHTAASCIYIYVYVDTVYRKYCSLVLLFCCS